MLKTISNEDKIKYECVACNLRYIKEEQAKKCGILRKEHKSCNIEIIA